MSNDGLPERAAIGARAAAADRRAHRETHRTHRIGRGLAVIGAVAAIGLFAAACSPASTASPSSPAATAQLPSTAPASESVAPSAAAPTQIALSFQAANDSKIFGGGIISDLGDGSSAVTIGLVAIGFDDPMPAEIVTGSCADAIAAPVPSGAPPPPSAGPSAKASAAPASVAPSVAASPTESVAPTPATLPVKLTDVNGGSSNTVVQIGLSGLLASPSAAVVHKSAQDLSVVACADLANTPLPSIGIPSLPSEAPASSDLPSDSALPSTAP